MRADSRTIQQILQSDRRFDIPVYQRPYVWNRDRQWEPLWDDVESTAIRLAEVRQAAREQNRSVSDADKQAAPHFMGAIVLEQYATGAGEIDRRSVVDGQQRLITLQLLLIGTLDALHEHNVTGPVCAKLKKLTRNDEDIFSGEDLYKVWPRPAERDAYLNAVGSTRPPEHESPFAAARKFFFDAAREFLGDDRTPGDPFTDAEPVQRRASLLVSTLLSLVKLVAIDLDDVDDAQVIFEALNARNTPLSTTDLVKNLLFMRAQADGHDPEELYESVWARFDKDDKWWREMVGIGHARRARQDWLLGDWLIGQLGRVINVGRLYGEFRGWLDHSGTDPVDALHTLNLYADAYESLHDRGTGATDKERRSFRRICRLNIAVATPVLLWLLTRSRDQLTGHEREMAFLAIESFVVRRMATKWQTRAYGRAFGEVLRAAQRADAHPGRAIVAALARGPHGYSWPRDDSLVWSFRNARYYGSGGINQDRLRLLLGCIDRQLQRAAPKTETVEVRYDDLHIEHVIPRSWKKHWPVNESDDSNEQLVLEQKREGHVHRIGNLTLTTGPLNLSMGHDPWEEKRGQLKSHSKLLLNAFLVEKKSWDEREIELRGEWLAEQVAVCWPGPESSQWEFDRDA